MSNINYEQTITNLEYRLREITNENIRVRSHNEELTSSLISIQAEIDDSYVKMRGIVNTIQENIKSKSNPTNQI